MNTLLAIGETAVGFFVAMAVWFLFMEYVRRKSGVRRDHDVLEHMAHGCAGCKGDGACHKRKAEEILHELA